MEEYNFKLIEEKWQEKWEKEKAFETKEETENKKCYVLEMFPYPSGEGLHVGHSFNYTIGDIYARFKRMKGFNVLYPMGYDAMGLPAENAAIKAGIHPKEYTEKSINNFMLQQKKIGPSYDWNKTLKTCDEDYYKWNQYFFLKMFEKGLVYRKKSPVNWCKKCETVLANEQVHSGKCWRHKDCEIEIKHLEQWFIKTTEYANELYEMIDSLDWPEKIKSMQKNWIGKSHGVEIEFEINNEKWKVFTTRPDTIYGVTFMVVSAQHPRLMELVSEKQKKEVEKFLKKIKSVSQKSIKDVEELDKEGVFTGSYATNPITNEKIPVYAGNFVIADYGSGMVMAVPAHDLRDYEFAKKYKIPIIRVISKETPSRSYLMSYKNISESELTNLKIKIIKKEKDGLMIEIPEDKLIEYEKLITEKLEPGFWNEYVGKKIVFIFKNKDKKVERIELNKETEKKINTLAQSFNLNPGENQTVWGWLSENKFYTDLIIHSGEGIVENSKEINEKHNVKNLSEIIDLLEKKKIASRTINFKLRDWLISRQRYWGTPIPMVYCKKCGIVPVPEKELPVKLPQNIKFGQGNPLETSKEFFSVTCPKCSSPARRETDTMDTFFDSSWYYFRYCDNKNNSEPFSKSKIDYWLPVNQYIGGAEHACMHLIYARFFTKALRDMGFVNIDEPFKKLFNQGMIHGEDGVVMSKSRGNTIDPLETISKIGADTMRMYLISVASADSDFIWSDKEIQGTVKFIKKIWSYFSEAKFNESSKKIESKINKAIKEITEDIEGLRYNLAVIKLRKLFNSIESSEISKEDAQSFLKMLSPFSPHIAEELWEKIGNKTFVSLEKWPEPDETKIDKKLEENEKSVEKTISDISGLIKLVKEKQNKEVKKIYLYVIPNETEYYIQDELKEIFGKDVFIFPVSDKSKYDPENKSQKAKPGRPAIYLE
jgi:leucyl-tRNA synthetase